MAGGRAGRALRGAGLGLLGRLFRSGKVSRETLRNAPISTILVVRQDDRIGNQLFITPLLSGLRDRFPGATVDLVVSSRFREILAHHPAVSDRIFVDRREFRKRPHRIPGAIRRLRRSRYDLIVDCKPGPSLSNTIVVLLARGGYRIALDHEYSRKLYHHTVSWTGGRPPHETERLHTLVREIWETPPCGPMEFHFPPGRSPGSTRNGVTMHIGGHGGKRIPRELVFQLVRAVVDRGHRLELLSGPDEESLALELESTVRGLTVSRPADVVDLAIRIAESRVFVGPDTGALHIASALNVPIVNLFPGPESLTFGPRGDRYVVVNFLQAGAVERTLEFLGSVMKDR